ncbi:ATP-binding protein [Azospirillum sp.]|uniref:ATP-binding protein n=1 Tax=Azospirillum sp. TaxID=34012 RepID=UPI002D70FE6C|nr:ATP-binding protein [Azospirillum sp.]HYF87131.1 ATP-binding protein [Azospirillum sp.]
MRFLILRILTHSELGMFHEYRRQGKEGSKQRALNFDWDVVDRVFPAAKDSDRIEMNLLYDTDQGVGCAQQWLKRQEKNWRLEGNCPKDRCYHFVEPGCLFAMEIDAGTVPSAGAWAVFPVDHPVTATILADGESCRLANSAMIALHDEEGARTWGVLSKARPDLFTLHQGNSFVPRPVVDTIHRLDPQLLKLNPENERTYSADSPQNLSLRQSIMAHGVQSPLRVYEDGTVEDGNRRLFNVNLLSDEGHRINDVPVIFVQHPDSVAEGVIRRINLNEAQQFTPIEQARAFQKLRAAGMNNSRIASKTPFTAMHVGNMLTLWDAGEDVHRLVEDGKISATTAVDTIRSFGVDVVFEAVSLAIKQGKSKATAFHVNSVLANRNIIAQIDQDRFDDNGEEMLIEISPIREANSGSGNTRSPSTMALLNDQLNGVQLAPNPARLVKILASVGHTLPSAVADLVDNAISADATEIAITFGRPDGGHGRWMSIADNGDGMDGARLAEAMRIGSDSEYEGNSLGKYGYGLKGASWSQAKVFTVVTKREGAPRHHLTWDVDNMDGWIAKSTPLEPWEEEVSALSGHGTVVLWKDMRPPHAMPTMRGLDPYSTEVMLLERHLALVFHRFLEGKAVGRKTVTITINEKRVEPNNPFGHPLASAYDAKTIRIPTGDEDGRVLVQAYLLPSEDEIGDYHAPDGQEVVSRAIDLIGLHGKRTETQGLFIYRHDRLIKWGGWHQMWNTNDEKTKLARVIVNFDKVLDDAFKINISKQIVQLPQQLQAEIKKVAEVARRDSQRKYRKRTPTPRPTPAAGPGSGSNRPNVPGGDVVMPTPTSSSTTTPPTPSRRIAVKPVKTEKFVWKVTRGMTGTLDVQVSELDPSLSALVQLIRDNSDAVAHLAGFLGGLDEVDAQSRLMARKSN